MSRSQWLRGVVATVLMATGIATAWGQETAAPPAQQKINLDIPSQPVAGALTALGQQSGLTIMLAAAAKSDAISPALVGNYTTDEALKRILSAQMDLRAVYLDSKTIAIRTVDKNTANGNSQASTRVGQKMPRENATSQSPPKPTDEPKSGAHQSNTAPPQTSTSQGMPEILIRGARTMNVDVVRTEDDVQPYTILTSKDIERSGADNVEDFLKQQLTMNTIVATNTQSYASSNGATSSINLRGLGPAETLVLIDGRRSAGVSIFGGLYQTDINGIPLSAIERIEVLPSSASAIYGGAAVGGVVNIILKKQFNGGDVSYSYNNVTSGSARISTVSASYGTSFNSGNTQIMVGGQYSEGAPLTLGDRAGLIDRNISSLVNNSASFIYTPVNPFRGATPNIASATGTYNSNFTVFTQTPLTLKSGVPLNSVITWIPSGTAAGADLSSALLANAGKYNLDLSPGTGLYGLSSPFGTTPTTKSVYATLRQSILDRAQLFGEFSDSSNSSRAAFNPIASASFVIPASATDNPFKQSVRINFPSDLTAPIMTDSVTHSMTLGMLAELAVGWRSEVDYTWSKNSFELGKPGYDTSALNSALAKSQIDPFVDTIAFPLGLGSYLSSTSYSGSSTLNDVSARLSGPIVKVPGGHATLTIGIEHRKEGTGNATERADYPLTPASSLSEVFFGQSQSTGSVYGEMLVPLVGDDNHVSGIRTLDLQVAGRTERYTVHNQTAFHYTSPASLLFLNPPQGVQDTVTYTSTNPTVGLKWKPIDAVAFRASYATAFLPPTAAELLPNTVSVCNGAPCFLIVDPKTGASYLVDAISGGNPKLRPQTSKDWDLGLIWTPLTNLRLDVEYYRILQPNYITAPTVQQVVGDPALIGRVTRDPVTGLITKVDASYANATEYKTAGYDLKADYQLQTKIGAFGIRLVGSTISYDKRQYQIGSPFLDFAGFPNDGGEAKYKANGTLSWGWGNWTVEWTASYFSSYRQEFSPGSPSAIQAGAPTTVYTDAQGSYSVSSQIYHDVFLRYSLGTERSSRDTLFDRLKSGLSLELGVKNVFNSAPPLDAAFLPYYYSPYGDPRMRQYRVALQERF